MTKKWRRFRRWSLAVGTLVLLVMVSLCGKVVADPASAPDRGRMMGVFADEILYELNSALGRAASAPADGRKLRIALWPFEAQTIPISKSFADELNAMLLSALLAKHGNRYEFVARQSLGTLIEDMRRTGVWDETGGAPVAAVLRSAGEVDILIEGRMRLDVGGVSVFYKALRMDGVILAQTSPARLRLTSAEASQTAGTLSLDQAVRAATRHFADRAHDMTELRLGGIRYQATGGQPPYGLLIQEKMSAALEDVFSNVLTNRRLKVGRAEIGPQRLRDWGGARVPAKVLSQAAAAAGPGVYRLSGTYWDFADGIEVRLALTDGAARQLGWTGRLRRDAAGTIALRPRDSLDAIRENDGLGPIAFHLSTARGEDPEYRIGEKLQLLLRVDKTAWVYCFYRQTDRTWVRLLPNAHFGVARLDGGRVSTIPGALHPFDLTVSGPVGADLIKCFATRRDVGRELPAALQGTATIPLGRSWDDRLVRSFRRLRDTDLSEASVIVTVAR